MQIESIAIPVLTRAPRGQTGTWLDALAVAFGTLVTLCVSGYQFGRGNHTVYLLEGLHLTDPALFTKDWFVSSTLQYHAVFSQLTAGLMRAGVLQPVFLVGYLLLAVLWQAAWLRFAQALGASRLAYAASVIIYYISGAGIGLGVYQFLQDGCFLPSNVSNVAMLWAFYLWATGRRGWSGVWFGVAGVFHLNYAVVSVGAWISLSAWDLFDRRRRQLPNDRQDAFLSGAMIVGSIVALVPSSVNILLALQMKLRADVPFPMQQFVELYVRFRHTHHFDPLHYPAALWITFLWPIPLAVWAWRRCGDVAALPPEWRNSKSESCDAPSILRQTGRIFVLMLALQVVAFLFAGVWYINESMVQMMLWRFSIYVKLLSCLGAAYLICDAELLRPSSRCAVLMGFPALLITLLATLMALRGWIHGGGLDLAIAAGMQHWQAVALFILLAGVPAILALIQPARLPTLLCAAGILVCVLVATLGWNRWLGWGMTPEQVDADYLKVCNWARQSTPVDAVFLVPPAETAFRIEAHRAIVVNYKHVPQLHSEILEWIDRLKDVLGTNDLSNFPHDYVKTMRALDNRYESRPPTELIEVAGRYQARYVVVDHDWGDAYRAMLVYRTESAKYFVYDLRH